MSNINYIMTRIKEIYSKVYNDIEFNIEEAGQYNILEINIKKIKSGQKLFKFEIKKTIKDEDVGNIIKYICECIDNRNKI